MPYKKPISFLYSYITPLPKENKKVKHRLSRGKSTPNHWKMYVQSESLKGHCQNICIIDSIWESQKTQNKSPSSPITFLWHKLILVGNLSNNNYHEKVTTFSGALLFHNNLKVVTSRSESRMSWISLLIKKSYADLTLKIPEECSFQIQKSSL